MLKDYLSYFGRSVASQATKIVTISKRTNL